MDEGNYAYASNSYIYPAVVLLGLPCICGVIVILSTWIDARHNVKVWREEFQYALDQQCPQLEVDVVGGEGDVYLDAYQLDYQWIGDGVTCVSNGRRVGCSCRPPGTDETEVTKELANDQ